MDRASITVQTYLDGHWHNAMVIRFDHANQGLASICSMEYSSEYIAEHLHALHSV